MRVAYIDSSVLVRYYLPLDPHHDEAIALIDDDDTAIVTSSWTRIEASGALVRASRSQRVSPDAALARLDEDTSVGPITLISVPQAEAECGLLHYHDIDNVIIHIRIYVHSIAPRLFFE